MKVSVSIPGVYENFLADLSEDSYKTILDEGRKNAILALLRAFTETYGNAYITHELGNDEPDLTSDELDVIVSNLWKYYDGICSLAQGINNHNLHDLISEYVDQAVEARMKVYRVKITCVTDRTIYVRARNADDIESAINNCANLSELMEDGYMDLCNVYIKDAHDCEADMDVDEI